LNNARTMRASFDRREFSIFNFQFSIFNLQYVSCNGKFFSSNQVIANCKLKIENLKLKIDGLRAEPALGQAFWPDTSANTPFELRPTSFGARRVHRSSLP